MGEAIQNAPSRDTGNTGHKTKNDNQTKQRHNTENQQEKQIWAPQKKI